MSVNRGRLVSCEARQQQLVYYYYFFVWVGTATRLAISCVSQRESCFSLTGPQCPGLLIDCEPAELVRGRISRSSTASSIRYQADLRRSMLFVNKTRAGRWSSIISWNLPFALRFSFSFKVSRDLLQITLAHHLAAARVTSSIYHWPNSSRVNEVKLADSIFHGGRRRWPVNSGVAWLFYFGFKDRSASLETEVAAREIRLVVFPGFRGNSATLYLSRWLTWFRKQRLPSASSQHITRLNYCPFHLWIGIWQKKNNHI